MTQVIDWIKIVNVKDMQVLQVKKHNYLGLDLDYSIMG